MSSTDKTKFKITETSKQANVDITSDKVQLPADSADHTLVAKVPSAANCTSGVTVEVEMSPDGEKWCAAQRKTISAGQSTQEVIGNQFATQLDPNTTNKHARGVMNRDLTTDQGYIGSEQNEAIRTDAADFMHHKMGVDKSFNYSQWFKTSEAPTNTYKPVLFRHGGYDNFENTKTVQLTDTSIGVVNGNAVEDGNTGNPGTHGYVKGGIIQDDSTFDLTTNLWSVGIWLKSNTNVGTGNTVPTSSHHVYGSTSTNHALFTTYTASFNYLGGFTALVSGTNLYIGWTLSGSSLKWAIVDTDVGASIMDGNWHHLLVCKNTTSQNISTNTGLRFFIDGSEITGYSHTGGSTSIATIADKATIGYGNITNQTYGHNSHTVVANFLNIGKLDNTCFWKSDQSANASTIYNSGQPQTNPTGSPHAHLRFEDSNDLALNSVTGQTVSLDTAAGGAASFYVQQSSLATNESIYITEVVNTTQNLSSSSTNENYLLIEKTGSVFDSRAAGMLTDVNTQYSPFYDATHQYALPRPGDAFSVSFWLKQVQTASGGYRVLIDVPDSTNTQSFKIYEYGNLSLNMGFFISDLSNYNIAQWSISSLGITYTDWNHFTFVVDYGANTSGNLGTYSKLSVNGGTFVSPTANFTSGTAITSSNFTNDCNELRLYNQFTGQAGGSSGDPHYGFDEIAFFREALTQQQCIDLHNSGKEHDYRSISSNITSYYKCGESNTNDVLGTSQGGATTYLNIQIYDKIQTSIYLEDGGMSVLDASYIVPSTITATSSDYPLSGANEFSSIFDTGVDFSISGWFKTPLNEIGTLFSNTGGTAATGMKFNITSTGYTVEHLSTPTTMLYTTQAFNDEEWHHVVWTHTPGSQKVYVDGVELSTGAATFTTNDDLRGDNGFTLLGDGQNNANATSPADADSSKLNATLSNWSLHSEVLDQYAVKQMYSNGHVRNIKNLPSVDGNSIKAWWQLNDQTTPEQDLIGSNDLQYQDGNSPAKTLVDPTILVDAIGETLVEDSINGNALTLSLTKSFNFTTNEWVSTADQDTALCLSLNGFEEQAEYFALWKCSQPNLPTDSPTETIDICDGDWHNVILSYRGLEDFVGDTVQEGDIVKFGNNNVNGSFHWTVSYDGYPLSGINNEIGADYIGGLNAVEVGNVGFAIYNRHLKFQTSNNEEVYKPHTQFSSGELGTPSSNYYKYGFEGYVDETSFHSDSWWVNQDASLITPSAFDQEKPYTIFGRTTALNNRGSGTGYPQGVPYPLSQPDLIEASRGTNQWINPYPIGVTQEDNNVSIGGLEAWYRWGDTAGDCSINVFDVRSSTESLSATETRSLNVEGVTDVDVFALTSSDSIYLEDEAATTGGGISYVNFTIQDLATAIGTATCTVKDFGTSILQYLRIKLTGSGTCDIGEGKLEIEVNHKKRRMK